MIHLETVGTFGSTFSPVNLLILVVLLAAVITLVVLAVRKAIRWVRRRRDTKAVEVS